MSDKELHELTSWTPALTDITVFWWPSWWAEIKKSTYESIKNLFKTSYDTLYQALLVSWTNIKTINSVSVLWSWDITIPALTDWDKWDITLTSSATVWTIDNDAVTNAKLANMASATIKWRTSVGTGDAEDLTGTQTTALLDVATTSLKWLMSPADKITMWLFPSICFVQRSSDQTIAPITNTFISFDTETTDTDSCFPWSWTEITIQEDWLYYIRWNIQFWLAWIWATFRIQIIVLTIWSIAENTVTRYASETEVWVSTNIYLTAGKVVKMAWYHTGGSSEYVKWWIWKVYLHLFKL